MAGFEDYVRRITERLELPEATKEGIRQEALAHLEDEAERLVAEGKTREEAEALAVEVFGRGDAIAGLVDEALAGRQERYRRKKAVGSAVVVAVFLALAVATGSTFMLFNAFFGAQIRSFSQTGTLQSILGDYGLEVGCFAILAAIAWRLAGCKKREAALSALVVLISYIAALAIVLDMDLLLSRFGVAIGGGAAINMYGFSVCPAVACAFALLVRRRWPGTWLTAAGLVSGVLGGAGFYLANSEASRVLVAQWGAWANALWVSPGLMAMQYVLSTWLFARAVALRRQDAEAGSEGRQPQLAS